MDDLPDQGWIPGEVDDGVVRQAAGHQGGVMVVDLFYQDFFGLSKLTAGVFGAGGLDDFQEAVEAVIE